MPLFDDIEIKPGEGALIAVRKELELRRSRWDRPGYHYSGGGDFLLQHGESWNGRPLPDEYARLLGEQTGCFGNALAAAEIDPSLTYVEGVYSIGASHYTPHAWCVTPDGDILELTLPTHNVERFRSHKTSIPFLPPDRWAYFGVRFNTAFVKWHVDHLGLPMLDRPSADYATNSGDLDIGEDHDFPVLKRPFDPNRTELPL